jgi:hypothetical protein
MKQVEARLWLVSFSDYDWRVIKKQPDASENRSNSLQIKTITPLFIEMYYLGLRKDIKDLVCFQFWDC